jgi:hypothetical protein
MTNRNDWETDDDGSPIWEHIPTTVLGHPQYMVEIVEDLPAIGLGLNILRGLVIRRVRLMRRTLTLWTNNGDFVIGFQNQANGGITRRLTCTRVTELSGATIIRVEPGLARVTIPAGRRDDLLRVGRRRLNFIVSLPGTLGRHRIVATMSITGNRTQELYPQVRVLRAS